MHTHSFMKDGQDVTVNVNSDFSGDAIIDYGPKKARKTVTIPAFFLPLICRNAVIAEAVSALEDLYASEE